MNAKKLKEINQNIAYRLLNELFIDNSWDPVVTNLMSETQCQNYFYKSIEKYFKNHANLIYWSKKTSINILMENSEIIPMMQHYNFSKYKDNNNL